MHVAQLFIRLTAGGAGVFPPELGGRSMVDPRLDPLLEEGLSCVHFVP